MRDRIGFETGEADLHESLLGDLDFITLNVVVS